MFIAWVVLIWKKEICGYDAKTSWTDWQHLSTPTLATMQYFRMSNSFLYCSVMIDVPKKMVSSYLHPKAPIFFVAKRNFQKKCILLQTEICLCWGSEQYFLLHSVATSSLLNIIVDASNKFGLSTFRDHSSKKYIFWAFWEVYLWEVDMLWIGLSKGSTISNRRWINHFCLCVLYEATWSNTTCNPQFNIYFTGLVAFDVNYRITLGMLSEMQFLLLENISQGDSPETYF